MKLPRISWLQEVLDQIGISGLDIQDAYIMGSVARGTATPDSDLDVTLIVPPDDTLDLDSLNDEILNGLGGEAEWEGRRLDIQVWFENDPRIAEYKKIPLKASTQPVTAGLLDFPRKKLPEPIFLSDPENPLPQMQPKLRSLILSEARKKLSTFGAELIGANLYGGAASYQYQQGADIDVSLYIDWDDFQGNKDLLEQAFKQIEIPYEGFKLHLFVKPEDQKEQIEVADAVYDVFHDDWKIPPLILPKGFDPEIFFQPLIEMAEKKAQEIDVQMGIVGREWVKLKRAVQARSEGPRDDDSVEKRIEIQKTTVQDEVKELCRMFVEIWKGRRKLHDELRIRYVQDRDIDKYERFQYPEVVWKYLDQAGYAEFLKLLSKAEESGVIEKLLGEI